MTTQSITRVPRSYRLALAAGAIIAAAGMAQAQVIEQGAYASLLTTTTGNNGPIWQSWTLASQNYGGGNNPNGASGRIIHTYSAGILQEIRVNVNELRNSGAPFVSQPTAFARNYGQVLFTPQVNTPYEILGSVTMLLQGDTTSSSSASGMLTLEVQNGPAVASFGSSIFRGGAFPVYAPIYDAASPLFGSATGMLNAGTTYRLSWDLNVSSNISGDTTLSANVATAPGDSFFAISFVPAPGATALLFMGGLAASRRRR